ncbi:MAG: PEP-CTERM sorting domain-containing protein [Phenylobacterium sp.]|uniref:PEPxxWA-CTERM sorting domain-containing protein n=1 Tax=Phenylobacterium sp. TaxID=1871053 RepID=UPI0025F69867|nr:PEPxxWA-CTERM sorting domain-containing protein [Phenylobacterium sp.]MBI1199911.1 PEP-CTERM sorting domain-containing protein [Phenylobacterium sp.]
MTRTSVSIAASLAATTCLLGASAAHAGTPLNWSTVVNNNTQFPGDTRNFNSYNQPSVNNAGLVVFRARTQGGSGSPASGILTRDMSSPGNPIVPIITRGSAVPQPNNTGAVFNEFPSIPRIDATSSMIATRGQSRPVLEYQNGVDPVTGEPVTTRGGTTGIYTNPGGTLITGAAGLGNVSSNPFASNPDLTYFAVPNTSPNTKFDQFPGAPSATGGDTLVFKGNWTDAEGGQTGVYFRDVLANGGTAPVQLIADSKTDIPGYAGTQFGSTAPPSAAGGRAVFLGVDNEAAPTKGGIYMAALDDAKAADTPSLLTTIASIGGAVVNQANAFFTQIGEALSFDGKHVAFWGAWGEKDQNGALVTATRSVTVSCGSIENAATSAFCLSQDDGLTSGSGVAGDGLYSFDVAVNQGFFITDVDTLETRLVAQTGDQFSDFVYWNFSGKVPGAEDEEDGELARWRSASFIASDGWNAAFKGSGLDTTGLYHLFGGELSTLAEYGMDGGALDPDAAGLAITSLGLERDSYRNGWLAINAGMSDGENNMAGVYAARAVPEPSTWAIMILGFAGVGAAIRRRRAVAAG